MIYGVAVAQRCSKRPRETAGFSFINLGKTCIIYTMEHESHFQKHQNPEVQTPDYSSTDDQPGLDLSSITDEEGRIVYRPELFSPEFNRLYAIYERAVIREVGLREVNGGNTNDYRQADLERRDAHIAASDQLVADLAKKGIKISSWEAENIINKMVENKFPRADEKDMLARAFLLDRD